MWERKNLYNDFYKVSKSMGIDAEAALLSMLGQEIGKQAWGGQVDMGEVKKDEVEIEDKRKYLLIRR